MASLLDLSLAVDPARALAATPLFAGLSAVDLARLVPELDELQFAAGDAVFRQGDAGDGLYLIRRGSVGVAVGSGDQQRIVAVLDAPAYFGEMALLSDAPRSASILALRPLQLWRLPRDRFDRLIERQPLILRHTAAEVTRRLSDTTRRLSLSQDGLAAVAAIAFDALDLHARRIVQVAALAGEVDALRLSAILGTNWSSDAFGWLVRESGFFRSTSEGRVHLVYDGLRPLALERLTAEAGEAGRRALAAKALDVLLDAGDADPRDTLRLAREGEDWSAL